MFAGIKFFIDPFPFFGVLFMKDLSEPAFESVLLIFVASEAGLFS
jgi:hypothetical protein